MIAAGARHRIPGVHTERLTTIRKNEGCYTEEFNEATEGKPTLSNRPIPYRFGMTMTVAMPSNNYKHRSRS